MSFNFFCKQSFARKKILNILVPFKSFFLFRSSAGSAGPCSSRRQPGRFRAQPLAEQPGDGTECVRFYPDAPLCTILEFLLIFPRPWGFESAGTTTEGSSGNAAGRRSGDFSRLAKKSLNDFHSVK
jgi:hypothetical protein